VQVDVGRVNIVGSMRPDVSIPLGRSGLSVTRLGLGAAFLSGMFNPVTEEEAEATVNRAWDLGVRYFDTAPLYGGGVSEQRLGRALADKPREEFVVSTKVGRLVGPGDVFDFTYDGVLRSLDESLIRLGLDRVDAVFIHDPEDRHLDEAVAGAYRALDELRDQGTIRAVGAGMNRSEPFVQLAREARFDCCLLAGRYTLLDQSGSRELFPLCEEEGIGVIAAGVYNSGILANPERGATFDYTPATVALVERAQELGAVCARHGVPLKAAAIQFPLRHSAVATVLSGVSSVAELEENVRMLETPIPPVLWEELRNDGLVIG
jgi:D-threo-aldose 1-dehydrogenase